MYHHSSTVSHHLLTLIKPKPMTQTTDNIIDRDELQDQYIQKTIDSLDIGDCMAILYDYMNESFDKYSDEELKEEVKEYYPELLDSQDS